MGADIATSACLGRGGGNIDYLFAVPAIGYQFVVAKQANGSPKKGSIALGIDGHARGGESDYR